MYVRDVNHNIHSYGNENENNDTESIFINNNN